MTPDLQAFLDAYRDAFNRLDGDAVAALYAEPSGISQGGHHTHWPDRTAVAANMRALCTQYREQGFVRAVFEPRLTLPLGDHDALVEVDWRIERAAAPPWRFATAYHLTRGTAGWQVRLCIAHEEVQARSGAAALSPEATTPVVAPLNDVADPDWLRLRTALWPDSEPAEHLEEMASLVADAQRFTQFMARTAAGDALGFAEASLRHDYVPGTEHSPVAFLEGLYVEPWARRSGVARALVAAVRAWAVARGCRELASDTPLDNRLSQRVHRQLGFAETERIVCFCQALDEPR